MSRRKIAELDTPFSRVEWPSVSQEDQDTILELLCTLLAPLGQHRRDHSTPSRGKRSRRRARRSDKPTAVDDAAAGAAEAGAAPATGAATTATKAGTAADNPPAVLPPAPELARFVDTGLACITRELARSASATSGPPPEVPAAGADGPPKPDTDPKQPSSSPLPSPPPPPPPPPYAAVFVVRSAHPSAFYSHFPQMVAVASHAQPGSSTTPPSAAPSSSSTPIYLVGFSRACEAQLSASLGIPRVSSVALRAGAPQAQGLLAFLQETVPPVDVRWWSEAQAGRYRPTQIHVADVRVGPRKKQKKTKKKEA
ncbi:hypothetical protein SPI_06710 [Niveomyces insectorum RCEF 264]|uniref:Uncharacterized protein n=1 Tax=Niveomyces insectorum RCEF 264 TaxID=1081102 RepID=A0A167RIP6_9HYPO|nr:hypothetical protein SPI_06710 [Niveomyces insectorum RCEF 264]